MKHTTLFAWTFVALLAGCGKTVAVEGQSGAKLSLNKPGSVTLHRGDMSKLDINIERKNLTGDVTVRFDKLPKGVDVVDASNQLAGDKATYTLRASDSADLVENYAAEVTATGPGGIAVTQPVTISVKEKRP